MVAIQQPKDLDTAYTLALIYEELGDGTNSCSNIPSATGSASRRQAMSHAPPPPPAPPARWVSRSVEEKCQAEGNRPSNDDKWTSLKAYRRSKGLCFICGEKWGKDHRCKPSIQLNIVQEMLECFQNSESDTDSLYEDTQQQLMMLSAAAVKPDQQSPKTMLLLVEIQGHELKFLVDSGSSSCFIDQKKSELLTGQQCLKKPTKVQVAGGSILGCTTNFPQLTWSAQGHEFVDNFRVLP